MTQQFDMVPLDSAALDRIEAQLPRAREVKTPRLPLQQVLSDEIDAQPMEAQVGLVVDATVDEMFHVDRREAETQ